jgi:hypothetical protein
MKNIEKSKSLYIFLWQTLFSGSYAKGNHSLIRVAERP